MGMYILFCGLIYGYRENQKKHENIKCLYGTRAMLTSW